MIFTTGIFARGDARYYTRIEFPDAIMVEGVLTPVGDSLILDLYDKLSAYTTSKLISIQKGIFYDASDIPDSDDRTVERRLKILCKFDDQSVKQIEIPAATELPGLAELFTDLSGCLYTSGAVGSPISAILKVDSPPERKARGK